MLKSLSRQELSPTRRHVACVCTEKACENTAAHLEILYNREVREAEKGDVSSSLIRCLVRLHGHLLNGAYFLH